MDIKELNKKQFILLTLLITFVVSIATGIVTVSLMNQMPESVPQTINNVIERTIEKVTTVQVQVPATTNKTTDNTSNSKDKGTLLLSNNDALISIYLKNTNTADPSIPPTVTTDTTTTENNNVVPNEPVAIGQGIIVSDIGLILVDSNLIKEGELYKVVLNKVDFDVSILKKYDNGFTILKISPMADKAPVTTDTANKTQ